MALVMAMLAPAAAFAQEHSEAQAQQEAHGNGSSAESTPATNGDKNANPNANADSAPNGNGEGDGDGEENANNANTNTNPNADSAPNGNAEGDNDGDNNTNPNADSAPNGNAEGDNDGDNNANGADGQGADQSQYGQVTICHATASETNPYVKETISVNGLNGHEGHEGGVFDPNNVDAGWGDIIPPEDDDGNALPEEFAAQNWPEGQDILADDCNIEGSEALNPALEVVKTADDTTVTLGADGTVDVTYTYTVTNSGNVALSLATFGDDQIAELDVSDLELEGTLEAGADVTLAHTATLSADDFGTDGTHTNVVTVVTEEVEETGETLEAIDDETVTLVEDVVESVTPDIDADEIEAIDGLSITVCPDVDVTLSLASDAESALEVSFSGDISLLEDLVDLDAATIGGGETFTATIAGLQEGTYAINYTVDGDADLAGTFEITVIDCDEGAQVGGDAVVDIDAVTSITVCPDVDTTLTLQAGLMEDVAADVEDLELVFASDSETLDLEALGLSGEDIVLGFDEDGTFAHQLSGLPLGWHTLDYEVMLDAEAVTAGSIDIGVVQCVTVPTTPTTPPVTPPSPDVESDVVLEADVLCPDDSVLLTIMTDGEDLDVTEGQIAFGRNAEDAAFWTMDIELGEVDLHWPAETDGTLMTEFVVWAAFGDATSQILEFDLEALPADCEEVLGVVEDRPESDAVQGPEGPESDVDADADREAAREDRVLGVVTDRDDTVGGDTARSDTVGGDTARSDTVAGVTANQLPRTGMSVFALVAAGLFALLSGAGLLRRRS